MISFLLVSLNYVCNARIEYFKDSLPFPFDSYTDTASISGLGPTTCISSALGDGRCNSYNNIPECDYDDGDCCRESCIFNCYYSRITDTKPVQMPILNMNSLCVQECGFAKYNCTQSAFCSECYNGDCVESVICPELSKLLNDGQCCICEDG